MTPQEAANAMTGRQYTEEEPSKGFFATAAKAGLVIVYGSSDDLIELEGIVRNEFGAPGTIYFTKNGLVYNDCQDDDCPYFKAERAKATPLKSLWDDGGFSWRYETDIPHVKFVIKEEDENYCEGIVFSLTDVPS